MQLLQQVTVSLHSSRLTQEQRASSGLSMEGCSLFHPPPPPAPALICRRNSNISFLSLSSYLSLSPPKPLISPKAHWETDSSKCECFYLCSAGGRGGGGSWLLFTGIFWKKTKTYKSKLLHRHVQKKKKNCCAKSVCATSHILIPLVAPASSGRR